MSQDYETIYATVGDIKLLKQKRGARRGAITWHGQYFQLHSKIPLKEIRPNEVSSKLDKLKGLVQEYEALQVRIEELMEEGEDFTDDNQLLVKHAQLVDEYEDLYAAHQVWSEGCHIQYDASVLISTTSLDTPPCRAAYDKLKKDHGSFLKDALGHSTRRDVQEMLTSINDLMKQLLDKASADFAVRVTGSVDAPTIPVKSDSLGTLRYSRLKLDLPKFSGVFSNGGNSGPVMTRISSCLSTIQTSCLILVLYQRAMRILHS